MARRKAYSRHTTIDLYIFREFALSTTVAFLFFFFIFFVNQILLIAKDILEKKAPVTDVLLLLFYAMPTFVAMSFPFASLVGTLIAVGRMSSESEIIVMQASGVSLKRIFAPFLVLGVLVAGLSFVMNDIFLPLGTINYFKLYRKLLSATPSLELKSYSVKKYQNLSTTIITGEVTDNVIHDLVIFDVTEERKNRVITSKTAQIRDSGENSNTISLVLEDVFTQVSDPRNPDRFEYSSADDMVYNILIKELLASAQSIGPQQMSSVDVGKVIDEKKRAIAKRLELKGRELLAKRLKMEFFYFDGPVPPSKDPFPGLAEYLDEIGKRRGESVEDRSIGIYRLEYWKKFSIPAGAFFFIFFAFPAGIRSRRSGISAGFTIGLLVAVTYWFILVAGQNFSSRLNIDPFFAMWFPDFLVLFAGIVIAVKRFVH